MKFDFQNPFVLQAGAILVYNFVVDNKEQVKLVAEFLSNVAVAWFAAGVIGIFVGGVRNVSDILASLTWGIAFSFVFLWAGTSFLKK